MMPPSARVLMRAVAIAIAAAALIDPVVTRHRYDGVRVAVVAGEAPGDAAVAARVRTALSGEFAVVRGTFNAAGATVIVGDALPAGAAEFASPVAAVVPDDDSRAMIDRVDAPAEAALDATVPVAATIRARHARGRTLDVTLTADGIVVDRVTRSVADDDARLIVPLVAVAGRAGAVPLRVEAAFAGGAAAVEAADAMVAVTPRRWRVLVYDARASWMSTFVRRALERDARFTVASRIATSTNVAATAGAVATRLDDAHARDGYDVIVVGAPDALPARDVAALDEYLRRRGGSVVLLLDAPGGGPFDRLSGSHGWLARESGPPLRLANAAPPAPGVPLLRSAELAWPARLPAGADAVVADSAARPIVWAAAVGAGRLTVSGALDAWRYRDRSQSSFDEFWTGLVAGEAARAVPAVRVVVTPRVARPSERVEVAVTVRDAALAGADGRPLASSMTVEGRLDGVPGGLRLLPDASTGRLVAFVRAPTDDGVHRIVLRAGGRDVEGALVVRSGAVRASGSGHDALEGWVASRGGRVFGERDVSGLATSLRTALSLPPHAEPWRPMRSPWWILPFALLLSWEWWSRRRAGLA